MLSSLKSSIEYKKILKFVEQEEEVQAIANEKRSKNRKRIQEKQLER